MLIFTIKTDEPQAEVGLYDDGWQLAYNTWPAHRELAETIERQIDKLLDSQHQTRQAIKAIIVYQGPGSFTGLRIGISVANAMAYSLGIPIVASQHQDWIEKGIASLRAGNNDLQVVPFYGAEPHITPPTK